MGAEAGDQRRCPHCAAGEPSVWDDVLFHYAHPAGDKLKMCHDPWRERCRRCSGDVGACACPRPIGILAGAVIPEEDP